jgi:hypothetical protein
MNNGLPKISILVLLILSIFNINTVNSNEIDIAPLLNLDNIAPSYDDFDENLNDTNIILDDLLSDELGGKKKDLAFIGVLNKVTAKVSNIEILAGEEVLIYDLKIFNKSCHISLPEEKPLVAVYLVIDDLKGKNNFSGWMVKDLPSISSMEHPLYDIWVKDCA